MEKDLKLIIIYGIKNYDLFDEKHQAIIDEKMTCGYRDYARTFGHIIYLTKQDLKEEWEHCFSSDEEVIDFCDSKPDHVVFSVKHCPEKNILLQRINNFKFHYPCSGHNIFNRFCDISLVDTESRIINEFCKIQIKGKDSNFWIPGTEKKYDYLLMGKCDNKNQSYFINRLTRNVNEKRKVLWIGGLEHKNQVNTHHEVIFTDLLGPNEVKDLISQCKIGILLSEIETEGFPQSFLEMTMCGVPVVYSGPQNSYYISSSNCALSHKVSSVKKSELLLKAYSENMSHVCRDFAKNNYDFNNFKNRLIEIKETVL